MRKHKFIAFRVYEDECQLDQVDSKSAKEAFLKGLGVNTEPTVNSKKAVSVNSNKGRPKDLSDVDDILRT